MKDENIKKNNGKDVVNLLKISKNPENFNVGKTFFNVYFFILRERERESENRGGTKKRGRQRILSRFHTVSTEPNVGLKIINHELMTWAQTKSWTLK